MQYNYEQLAQNPNIRAFLNAIAWAEGANYNTLYGGGTFSNYSQHPNRRITAGGYTSTAAGRYQFLYGTWIGIQRALSLPDFSPHSQDLGAIYLIAQKGAISNILNNDPEGALKKFGCLWAALPYSTCNQRTRKLSDFLRVYGVPASTTPTPTPNQLVSNSATTNSGDSNVTVIAITALLFVGLLTLIRR